MKLGLKYFVLSLLFCYGFTTGAINKQVILEKLQDHINDEKFDGSTFMLIEDLLQSSVEKALEKENTTIPKSPGTYNKGAARFNTDLIAKNIQVGNGCSGDTINTTTNVEVTNMLNTTYFKTKRLYLDELAVNAIYNPFGPIVLRGNLKMASVKTTEPINPTSFLVKDVQQWVLFKREIFQDKNKVEGWSFVETSSCENSKLGTSFLGGPCLLNTEITKKFEDLPPHKKLRIKATVHLFDNWEGESIYLQTDGGKTLWTKKGTVNKKYEQLNRCGNPEFGDPLMNLNIDKMMDHQDNFLTLRFNTNMAKDSCQASYGIGDISLYIQQ